MFEWRDQEKLIAEALDTADDGNLLSFIDKLREMRHRHYSKHKEPLWPRVESSAAVDVF